MLTLFFALCSSGSGSTAAATPAAVIAVRPHPVRPSASHSTQRQQRQGNHSICYDPARKPAAASSGLEDCWAIICAFPLFLSLCCFVCVALCCVAGLMWRWETDGICVCLSVVCVGAASLHSAPAHAGGALADLSSDFSAMTLQNRPKLPLLNPINGTVKRLLSLVSFSLGSFFSFFVSLTCFLFFSLC